jgi:ADP-heptose:LPS heptosyltransferase
MLNDIRKILIIQFRPFGDILLSTSYLPYLKAKFPEAEICYVCNPPFHTIIEKHPFIDRIITIPSYKKIWRFFQISSWLKIRKEKFDLIIDHQNGTESKLFVLFSGAKYRLGWSDGKWSFALNIKAPITPEIYSAYRNLYMPKPLGIEENTCKLIVTISEEGKKLCKEFWDKHNLNNKLVIGIEASCREPRKRWYLEGFEAFIRKLLTKTNASIVLISAPAERKDLEKLSTMLQSDRVFIAPPTATMREAAALVEKFDLLVCNEGAMNHLSCATNTPALCLIGKTDHLRWSPMGFFEHHRHLKNLDWNPNQSKHYNFGISPDLVYDTTIEMLKEVGKI